MYMNDTKALVNEMLKFLSAGVLINKNSYPKDFIKIISKNQINSANSNLELKRVLNHMSRIGLIKREKLTDGNTYIILTAKGKKRLNSVILETININTPKKWDGRWRIVSFDIPRAMRSSRYELLRELHRLGFQKLQQSMWVHPYACKSEVNQLATALGLKESLIYIEANFEAEESEYLKTQFSGIIKNSI